jgi:hypothetical protein
MTLSICNYKTIYICIVVAQDFQVSNSGSWDPLVLEPPWIRVKGTSTPTGLIIQVINNDLFLTVIQARIQGGSKTRGSQEPELL